MKDTPLDDLKEQDESRQSLFWLEWVLLLILCITGLAVLISPLQFSSLMEFKTFTFPKYIALFLSVMTGYQAIRMWKGTALVPLALHRDTFPVRFLLFFVALIAYAVALPSFSYYWSTAIFFPVAFLIIGKKTNRTTVFFCITIWLLFVYVVFEKLFLITLP